MYNNKKVFIGLGCMVGVAGILFFIKPKAKVTIRKDGSGIAQLGFRKREFSPVQNMSLISWNGYELTVTEGEIKFRKWGRDLVNADKSPKIDIVAG